jgi:hypothetical protein
MNNQKAFEVEGNRLGEGLELDLLEATIFGPTMKLGEGAFKRHPEF